MQVQDKVALVTGGTSGIGKATAQALAAAGAKVVLSGRREPEGRQVAAAIRQSGGVAHYIRADVTIESEVQQLVAATVQEFGRLDIAFNNAGVEHVGSLAEFSAADYRRIFDTNVLGVFLSLKYEIPEMIRGGGGAIINTSSVAGHVGLPGVSVYIASKHAVEGLTKTAALELARHAIRVNAIAPGAIVTDMIDRFAGPEGTAGRNELQARHPLGRMGRSEEVAAAVLYLASEASSFCTGVSLPVDGGWLAT